MLIKNIIEAVMNMAAGWLSESLSANPDTFSRSSYSLRLDCLIIYGITSPWSCSAVRLFCLWAHCPCHAGSLSFGYFLQGSMSSHLFSEYFLSLKEGHSGLRVEGSSNISVLMLKSEWLVTRITLQRNSKWQIQNSWALRSLDFKEHTLINEPYEWSRLED